MKFDLDLAGLFYTIDDKRVPVYEKYGFVFESYSGEYRDKERLTVVPRGTFGKTIQNTVEIKELDDLLNLIKDVGEVVVSHDGIIIYDDYLE